MRSKSEIKDHRIRTIKLYNLDLLGGSRLTMDGIPIMWPERIIPKKLIGFNYAGTSKDKKAGIHFYLDDYQIERVWRMPEAYVPTLSRYECILSPDFSLHMDMPMPMKIWNVYRSRLI